MERVENGMEGEREPNTETDRQTDRDLFSSSCAIFMCNIQIAY